MITTTKPKKVKTYKGRYTKPNIWDEVAKKVQLVRREPGGDKDCVVEPGVTYFIVMLNQLGCDTFYSCEGHPRGFYVIFRAPYAKALLIKQAMFFSIEIEGKDMWALRAHDYEAESTDPITMPSYVDRQRWAAQAWENKFGPIDWKNIKVKL